MFIIHMNILLLGMYIFPFTFNDTTGIIGAIIYLILNCLYLYPGYLIYTRQVDNEPSKERLVGSLLMLTFGTFFSTAANCQKYFTIKAARAKDPKAEVLITDGLFSWTRSPNFLGDICLSLSFCFFINELYCWFIYGFLLFSSMYPRLMLKEASLKKKKGAEVYYKRTWMLFPKVTTSLFLNLLIYLNILGFFIIIYFSGGVEDTFKNVSYMLNHHLLGHTNEVQSV